MVSKEYLKRHSIWIITWCICSLIVVGLIANFYITAGHNGLPIGWDTPRYVGQTRSILEKGVTSFVQDNEYYNVVYAIFSSAIVMVGLSPLAVEIVLPIALCISLVAISGILVKSSLKDNEIAIYTTLFAASWFTVYRLGSDLHPNLAALVLLLACAYYFLAGFEAPTNRKRVLVLFLFTLASFTHIETTIFFAVIFLVSALGFHVLTPAEYSLKRMLVDSMLMLISLAPSTVLYIQHMRTLLSYTEGVLVSQLPMSTYQWIAYIGLLLPIAVLGLGLVLRDIFGGRVTPYGIFLGSWASLSLAVALAHYALPSFQSFSERALILFPSPALASLGIRVAIGKALYSNSLSARFDARKLIGMAFIVVVFVPSLLFTRKEVTIMYDVTISSSAYARLTWLTDNLKPRKLPIFVFNGQDQYAGTLGDLHNNWVQAVYGNHYSYLGDVSFLLAQSETPYYSLRSQAFSRMFITRMRDDGLFNNSDLPNHRIVLIADFYLPRPLPSYDRAILDEIEDGIYIVNPERARQRNGIYIPLYSSIKTEESTSGWYAIQRDWTESLSALEFWSEKPASLSHSEFSFPINKPGNYSLLLRYWDGKGASDMILKLNGDLIGRIVYGGSAKPANFTENVRFTSESDNILEIVLEYDPRRPQYASLDYVKISLDEE